MTQEDDNNPPASNVDAVRGVLDSAQPVHPPAPDAADGKVVPIAGNRRAKKNAAKKPAAADGDAPAKPEPRKPWRPVPIDKDTGLPEGCPVTPLGIDGLMRYYLDASCQLVSLAAKEHGRLPMMALFGTETHLVHRLWPRIDKDGFPTGSWKPELAAEQLMAAAARCGVFDPHERVRGAGAWRGVDGELILNCGDKVWAGPTREDLDRAAIEADDYTGDARTSFLEAARRGRWMDPGRHGRFVYPGSAPQPRPIVRPDELKGPVGRRFNLRKPGEEMLKLFRTWRWKRGEIDAMLLLGWVCAAMIGGALKWRPMAWVTGGAGTGKSTLQGLIDALFGEGGLIDCADTTAAGVYQLLGHRTLPIAIDELEADADNTKVQSVIKLARLAASGGKMMRGGADHEAVSFVIRSCFLFSSILIPPLLVQDRSRLAILELLPFKSEDRVPDLDPRAIEVLGRALRQRLVDQWYRLDETVEFYRAALGDEGFNARGQDQFGALLACADLALYDHPPEGETARELVMKLGLVHLQNEAQRAAQELSVLQPLLAQVCAGPRPGEVWTVAQCIEKLLEIHRKDQSTLMQIEAEDDVRAAKFCRDTLRRHGVLLQDLEFKNERHVPVDGWSYIAIANSHPMLSQIYRGTGWNTPSGADESVWAQALMRIRGALPSNKTLWFGLSSRASLIPVTAAIEPQLDRTKASTADGEAVDPSSL